LADQNKVLAQRLGLMQQRLDELERGAEVTAGDEDPRVTATRIG
jgi:hypothetical protein